MKENNKLLLIGGATAAYFLLKPPSAAANTATAATPSNGVTTALSNFFSPSQPQAATIPTNYGINGGYIGNSAATVSNYAQVTTANPNLLNPNYQLTAQERADYVNNYSDIAQGVPTWPGGLTAANIQKHWTLYGCAQKRIFISLVPPSTAPYIAPQVNKKAKGKGILGFALQALTAIGAGVLEVTSAGTLTPIIAPAASSLIAVEGQIHGINPAVLNDAEAELLFTGAAIIKDILPFYAMVDRPAVNAISDKLNSILTQYS